jgi:hypothetical protein
LAVSVNADVSGTGRARRGWLEDTFGVSWQVVPTILGEMLQDNDPAKPKRFMAATMTMKKLKIDPREQPTRGGEGRRRYRGRAICIWVGTWTTAPALALGAAFSEC